MQLFIFERRSWNEAASRGRNRHTRLEKLDSHYRPPYKLTRSISAIVDQESWRARVSEKEGAGCQEREITSHLVPFVHIQLRHLIVDTSTATLTIIMLSNIGRAAIRRVGAGGNQSTARIFQSAWNLQRGDTSKNADNASIHPQLLFSLRRSYAAATKATQTTRGQPKTAATAKPKTKKAVKKPVKKATKKPKGRPVKKVVTEEQKGKADLKKLKLTALTLPKGLPSSAWKVLLQETIPKGTTTPFVTLSKEAAVKYKSLTPEELEVSRQSSILWALLMSKP
jgi:hypothetical protein